MTDKQVKYFLLLADNLNYTKTAKELNVAQSTLSAHISAMEKSFGFRLFTHHKRSVELSPEGQIMRDALRQSADILARAHKEAAQLGDAGKNVLTIGIAEGQNVKVLREKGKIFSAGGVCEHVEIKIRSFGNAELVRHLDEGTVDAIICYSGLLDGRRDLDGVKYCKSDLFLVSRNDGEQREFPQDFQDQSFVLQSRESDPLFEEYYEAFCHKTGFRPKEVSRVSTIASVMMNIELGLGISLIDELSLIYKKPGYSFLKVSDIRAEYDLIYRKNSRNKALHMLADKFSG